jgi:hypothetical protein
MEAGAFMESYFDVEPSVLLSESCSRVDAPRDASRRHHSQWHRL